MRQAFLCCAGALAILTGCGGIFSSQQAGAGGGASGGSPSSSSCGDIQRQAQLAADTSCRSDGDCVHPPHGAGDCTECGVVLNGASEQSSFMAVQSVCKQFDAQGCVVSQHSCFYQRPYCDAGVCGLSSP